MVSITVNILIFFALCLHVSSFQSNAQFSKKLKQPKLLMSKEVSDDPLILQKACLGEKTARSPVWLMRQAGRYLPEFRKYSDKISFRERSETPEIAIELSLQPWRRYGLDGVIMFSDILTPLPGLGIDFTIQKGIGPKIRDPIRTQAQINEIPYSFDIEKKTPFLAPIIQSLRKETEGKTSLIGFIGAPWTLAAYCVEGCHTKLCPDFKEMMFSNPIMAHNLLDKLTSMLCEYASYQIQQGVQVLQVFESWAYFLDEYQFITFVKPYVERIAKYLKNKHPQIPIVYFAHGGSMFLSLQNDLSYNALSLDWRLSMGSARKIVGPNRVLAGNLDPRILYTSPEIIRQSVSKIISEAQGHHVFNLGHGIEQDTPIEAIETLVQAVKEKLY